MRVSLKQDGQDEDGQLDGLMSASRRLARLLLESGKEEMNSLLVLLGNEVMR